jgi:selenocysteine lyase/cysteine desulfurase
VHYAPHGLVDVQAWDCDFLACSAYKFFGPHIGILWGRRALLEGLAAYKVRPAPNTLPGKWMTGTQSHEGIAGVLAAVDYMADLGREVAGSPIPHRRDALRAAYHAIGEYERVQLGYLLAELAKRPEIKVWGITDPLRFHDRVSTISITHERLKASQLAIELGQRGIFVWHGNYYALNLSEDLGQEPEGMVRIGLCHYNTREEIDRLMKALDEV